MKVLSKKSFQILGCAAALAFTGCHRQRPVVLLPKEPPPATAPADTSGQQPSSQTTTTGQPQQQPNTQEQQQTGTNNTSTNTKPAGTQPRHPKHTTTNHKPAPEKPAPEKTQEAKNLPPKIVIREGGSNANTSAQVTSGAPQDQAARDKQNTTTGELLDQTDKNLRSLTRQLSDNEQSMVAQIRDFMSGSRQAIKDGDMARAHFLASKAHDLSEDLVKQR